MESPSRRAGGCTARDIVRLRPRPAGCGAALHLAGGALLVPALCLVFALALGAIPGASRAGALDGLDHAGVRAELERTDMVIERAADALRDCSSVKGQALLAQARTLQQKAWDRFSAGTVGPQGDLAALELTKKARSVAVEALETCQVEFKGHEALRGVLDSTQELAAEAQTAVSATNDEEARKLLDAGIWQLDKAREAYRSGEYRKAITLGAAARNLIERALQRARANQGAVDSARLNLVLDRTDVLLAEVRGQLQAVDDAKARALLDQAQKAQSQAREFARQGRPAPALRSSQRARDAALDALWLVQRSPDSAQVGQAIDMVDRMAEELGPEIRASGSEEALRLYEKAVEQVQSARRLLGSGDATRAAQTARLADSLLRRATEKSGTR